MNTFLHRHADKITGHLSGLDRLVIRGTLREIAHTAGLDKCLTIEKVLIKDFPKFAASMTESLVSATVSQTETILGRPPEFLDSPQTNKEARALEIAKAEGITSDLICVLKSVEPCRKFDFRKNQNTGHVELVNRSGKCAFFYHYGIHPVFGFMNIRIQTWVPFTIQVCLNGREWLARQMDRIGLSYTRNDNTFTAIEDVDVAQRLMNEQLRVDYLQRHLEELALYAFPQYPHLFSRFETRYNWTVYQSEVATDVMFNTPADLQSVYRPSVLPAITLFDSGDVIRFLGQRRVNNSGEVRANFSGEVTSDYKHRPEGVRVKHSVNSNSVKTYDKADSVLRVETTINKPDDFTVLRPKEGGPKSDVKFRDLRRGIEDLGRRFELSCGINGRYLDALATLDARQPLRAVIEPLTRPSALGGVRVRGLNPNRADDAGLFAAVNRGCFLLNGFRNRNITEILHASADDPKTRKRHAANVTRRLRMLRAHGLIERIPRTHRYQVTQSGRTAIVAALAALEADTTRLVRAA